MEKPLVIKKREFAEGLRTVINNSGLPAFMLTDILRNAICQLDVQEQQELLKATQEWQKNSEAETEE